MPTAPCVLPGGMQSEAIALSPVDGMVYFVEKSATANPRMGRIDPANCTAGPSFATTLPARVARLTFCPDGRLYAGSGLPELHQLNPTDGRTLKILVVNGLPNAPARGDMVCTSTGDFYVISQRSLSDTNQFALYRIDHSKLHVTAAGPVSATLVGLTAYGYIAGLAEVSGNETADCSKCLLGSASNTTSRKQGWAIDMATGASRELAPFYYPANVSVYLADLASSIPAPVDLSISNSAEPADAVLGRTVTYTMLVSNLGSGATGATVKSSFPASVFSSVSWNCAVVAAGTEAGDSDCVTASGGGALDSGVILDVGGSLRFTVLAVVKPDATTGSYTNTASVSAGAAQAESNSADNSASSNIRIRKAQAKLTIDKTNQMGSLVAGQIASYTVTIANLGPDAAPGAVVKDLPSAGLDCASIPVTCNDSVQASCPAKSFPFSTLADGVQLSPFPSGSRVDLVVTCMVTATGI
jgi:uncharacterized repeat protein (TIGR01451 family)